MTNQDYLERIADLLLEKFQFNCKSLHFLNCYIGSDQYPQLKMRLDPLRSTWITFSKSGLLDFFANYSKGADEIEGFCNQIEKINKQWWEEEKKLPKIDESSKYEEIIENLSKKTCCTPMRHTYR